MGDQQGNKRRLNRSNTIALGGVLAALILTFMSFARALPAWDLTFNCLTSFCVAIMCIETGYRGSFLLILAASALALIFPGPVYAAIFLGFFGIYPLIKAQLESRFKRWLAILIKIILAFGAIVVGLRLYPPLRDYPQRLLERIGDPGFEVGPGLLFLLASFGLIFMFLIYDLALTALITIYVQQIKPRFRR